MSRWGITGVCVTRAGNEILKDVGLTFGPDEAIALVGPSGAGKTTMLRVLAGMIRPDKGQIELDGNTEPWALPRRDKARLVGMLQQRLDLVPQLTVRHNVQAGMLGSWGTGTALAALVLPLESVEATEAVTTVGLGDRLDDRVASLSGGEQQRVAIARLIVQAPQLLLADEPVASLDPKTAEDVLGLLNKAGSVPGRTLIASLHDPMLATRFFDRVVGVSAGRIAFDLPSPDVQPEQLHALYEFERPQ